MSINSNYKNVPLKSEDLTLLSSEFLGFGTILGLTFELAKQEFTRLFVKPILWKVACVFVPLTSIISSFIYLVVSKDFDKDKFLLGLESMTSTSSADEVRPFVEWFVEKYTTGILILLIAIALFLVFLALINCRNLYIFNNKKISSIWKTPRPFYLAFLKILAVVSVYSLARGIIEELIKNQLISFILTGVLALVFYGLLGLYQYFILFEESSIEQSLTKSYTCSKPYFGENILRWLWFSVIVALTCTGVFLATIIWIIPVTISNFQPLLVILFIIMTIIGLFCFLVISFVTDMFGYLSFLNLVLLNSELAKNKTINEIDTKNIKNDITIF
jgi:hypothetical protein